MVLEFFVFWEYSRGITRLSRIYIDRFCADYGSYASYSYANGMEVLVMHSIFYGVPRRGGLGSASYLVLAGAAAGILLAVFTFAALGSRLCAAAASLTIRCRVSVFASILCSLLPLVLSALLGCIALPGAAVFLPACFSSFLLCFFSLSALQIPGPAVLMSLLLLCLGRCAALIMLYWFSLRRFISGECGLVRDFLWAAALTAAIILLTCWLAGPGLATVRLFWNT